MVSGILIGATVAMVALELLLWWLVAHRGSTVAKWIVVLLLAYGLFSSATGLAQAQRSFDLAHALSLLAMVFDAVALAALFMRDARVWFAGDEFAA